MAREDSITGFWVCVDCAQYIANGHHADMTTYCREREKEIERGVEHQVECGYEFVLGTDATATTFDVDPFSWRYCDCCGSSLGGERHAATLIRHS